MESRVARACAKRRQPGHRQRRLTPQALAQVFWIGWEGAVMRARLVQVCRTA
ncbi:TetR family transcriptional regulator C-terminal domain-containing protein [Klebsiella pneumoniae subsp. pneumoniae]|nr:TetR family transcriptional regulator C-terminal domain-containing protein [Klebsiella pneumoniae subsp. pneumoniae]